MGNAIDGIESKLARADAHFKTLQMALKPILNAKPDLIPGKFDPSSGHHFFHAKRDSRSGDWLSPVIGDYVHNLRSALDYIVWAMTDPAIRASKKANKVEFPIFPDKASFDRWAPPKIGGIPPKAQAAIECLQPFNGPDCRSAYGIVHHTERPLWHLLELDNWDKHRALNLTEHLGLYTLVLPPEWDIYTSGNAFALGNDFKRGARIAQMSLGPGRDPMMKVYLRTTYDVAFDEFGPESVAAEPVLQTLDNIRSEIRRRVLPSLREFLPT